MANAAVGVASNGHNKVPNQTGQDRYDLITNQPEVAAAYARGSQWFLVGWFTYPGFIWTLKLCMLFLLKRLTRDLWINKFIKPTMVLVLTCYIVGVIVICTYCRPFYKYWQIYPDPGGKHKCLLVRSSGS